MDDFIEPGPMTGQNRGDGQKDAALPQGEEVKDTALPQDDDTATEDDKNFDEQYVKDLREENKKKRLENQKLKDELEAVNSSIQLLKGALSQYFDLDDSAALEEIKRAVEEGLKAVEETLIYSAFASEATKAGMAAEIIPDAFKLADLEGVQMNLESREVVGAADAVQKLLKQKAYLFSIKRIPTENVGSETNPVKGQLLYSNEIEELAGELGVTPEFAAELSRQRSERTGKKVGLSDIWRRPKKAGRRSLI